MQCKYSQCGVECNGFYCCGSHRTMAYRERVAQQPEAQQASATSECMHVNQAREAGKGSVINTGPWLPGDADYARGGFLKTGNPQTPAATTSTIPFSTQPVPLTPQKTRCYLKWNSYLGD